MGGVENPGVVDLVTYDPKADEYAIIMVETRPWDGSEQRLAQLAEKIENYISFALDGQMTEVYPHALGKRIRLQLDCETPPDPHTARFLEQVRERLEAEGLGFALSVGD